MNKETANPIAESLERLTKAVDRLDGAARALPAIQAQKRDHEALAAKLSEATRHNEILREAANRVAAKLDGQIGRLTNALKD